MTIQLFTTISTASNISFYCEAFIVSRCLTVLPLFVVEDERPSQEEKATTKVGGASPSQVCFSWCMQGTVVDVSSLFPRDGWLPWNIMKYIHSFYTQQFLTRLLVPLAVLLWILCGRWKKLSITLGVVPVVQRNCWRELYRPRRAK